MNTSIRTALSTLALALAVAAFVPASSRAKLLTPAQQHDVVDGLIQLLDELYVIPEMADALAARLRDDLEGGRFASVDDPQRFAATLTEILQELSGDRHLRVSFRDPAAESDGGDSGPSILRKTVPGDASPDSGPVRIIRRGGHELAPGAPDRAVRRMPGSGEVPRMLDQIEPFPGVRRLAGNVGCVEVRLFAPREGAEEKAIEAMESVSGVDAVLFDLRGCMGGAPDMVHLITSYLYGPDPIHLLTYYHAHEDPDSAYTLAEVPGERMPDVPVYIVTSGFTASGGEEFTYNLKHHGRATVVGEQTAGAGHGGGVHPVAAGFEAFIPDFRPVHPVTGGGWEGVGVKPDLEAPADKALAVAHREALREIVRRKPDRQEELAPEIARLDAEIERQPEPRGNAALAEYAGIYEIRTIRVKEGALTLQRVGGPELTLVAGDEADTFTLELLPSVRIRFGRDDTGQVSELHVLNMQGQWEMTRKGPEPHD